MKGTFISAKMLLVGLGGVRFEIGADDASFPGAACGLRIGGLCCGRNSQPQSNVFFSLKRLKFVSAWQSCKVHEMGNQLN